MIKKLIVLAIAATASICASASNIQYYLSGPISGVVVQADNQGIIYYDLNLTVPGTGNSGPVHIQLTPRAQGGDYINFESTYSKVGGITNFGVSDSYDGDQFTSFSTYFSTAANGQYLYKMDFTNKTLFNTTYVPYSGSYQGYITPGPVSAGLQEILDQNGGVQPFLYGKPVEFIGSAVPEPGSLALIAIGVLGAFGVARRRKA